MHEHTHTHPGTEPVTHTHGYPDRDAHCCAAKPHRHADGIAHSHPHADGCTHADRLPKHRPVSDDDPTADTDY